MLNYLPTLFLDRSQITPTTTQYLGETMELDALKQFKCLMDQCVKHCCVEWMVVIDPDTLENWNNQSDEINKSLHRLAKSEQTPSGKHWVMRKKEDGNCASLDINGLCTMQAVYGESMLPAGCKSFPRQTYKFSTNEISTASLACPEITRLISKYAGDSLFNNNVYFDNTSFLKLSEKDRIFYKVYCFINKVISVPNVALSLKLYLITESTGNLINNLEQVGYDSRYFEENIRKNLSGSAKKLKALSKQNSKHTRIEPEIFILYWKAVTEIILKRGVKFHGLSFERSDICLFLTSMDYTDNSDKKLKEFTNMLSIKNDNKTEAKEIDRLLKNYVLVTYLNHGFPLKPHYDNLLLSLAYCNVTFAITSEILIAYKQQNKIVTKTDVINIIWQVERILKDSDDIYEFIAANPILFDPDQHSVCIRYLFGGFIAG